MVLVIELGLRRPKCEVDHSTVWCCKGVPVPAIKVYGGVEIQLHSFLTSALEGDEWSASCPESFLSGKDSPQLPPPKKALLMEYKTGL